MKSVLCWHGNVLVFLHIISMSAALLEVDETLPKFSAGLKLSCTTKCSYRCGRMINTIALNRVSERSSQAWCRRATSSCALIKKWWMALSSRRCNLANCLIRLMVVVVSSPMNRCWRNCLAVWRSPRPSLLKQSWRMNIRLLAFSLIAK